MSELQRRVRRSQRQPGGLRPCLRPAALSLAHVAGLHIARDALLGHKQGRSSGVGFQLGVYFQFFDITSILAYTVAFAAVVMAIEALIMRPLDQHVSRGRA